MNPPRYLFNEIKSYGNDVYKLASDYCNNHEQLAVNQQQLIFNNRCRKNKIIPKTLRLRSPIQTSQALEYFNKTIPNKCLKFYVNNNHHQISKLNKLNEDNKAILQQQLPINLTTALETSAKLKHERKTALEKERLKQKYELLIMRNQQPPNEERITNLSNKELTENEKSVISKGLNFNTGYKQKDVIDLTAALDKELFCNDKIAIRDKPKIRQDITNAIAICPK